MFQTRPFTTSKWSKVKGFGDIPKEEHAKPRKGGLVRHSGNGRQHEHGVHMVDRIDLVDSIDMLVSINMVKTFDRFKQLLVDTLG